MMQNNTRDADIRHLAGEFSKVASGYPADVSAGAAALFVVAQCEHAKNPEFDAYVRRKFQQVVQMLAPKEQTQPLRPCPFCGGECVQSSHSQAANHGNDPQDVVTIGCPACNIYMSISD